MMKKIMVLSVFALSIMTLSSFKADIETNKSCNIEVYQEGLVVYADYKGYTDTGYTFEKKDKKGNITTFTFHEIKPKALKKYDLKSDALVGTFFKITFNKDDNFTKEEHDDKHIITDLEKH
ncbi:hypothetical protein KFZ70_07365 [Tamlana fucoidanivorans]|uniref:Uncharacterized protein n=1 Tax=Allotamlana fucoidanivorans TaxID=2583814 RepID=A0A5C4SJ43_9FLAO|nr:hypothetical protein [Tamlana fucoidanivorans]TNJ43850.1 hypothetical protein FGF67_10830 [Tamlana fucoidanivorans]